MAHNLTRRALHVLAQAESARRRLPVGSGVQTLSCREDVEHRDSELVPAHSLELELPDVLRKQTGGSPQLCNAFAVASHSRRFSSTFVTLSSFSALFHLQPRLLHSSTARYESAVGQAAQVGSVQAPAGAAVKADPVRDTKALLRTATLTLLREQLRDHERAWISLPELYRMCRETGTADSDEEAAEVVAALDKAGVLIQLRDKAFLRPEEIAQHVLEALPAPLVDEKDPRVQEFEAMQLEKRAIDGAARAHARRYLWLGWGALSLQTAFFFRLTFWELSWDVMEPITYFAAMTTGIFGYAWFLVTRKEPSYSDAFTRFYLTKQEKVAHARHFDLEKYYRLQRQVQSFRKQQARSRRTGVVDDDD